MELVQRKIVKLYVYDFQKAWSKAFHTDESQRQQPSNSTSEMQANETG